MSDRPELGSISTSPDDVGGRRRAPTSGRRRSGSAAGSGDSGGGSRGDRASRGMGISLVIAVLLAGLAVSGWFIFEQQQRLQRDAEELASARVRLDALEDRLRTTDEALSETGATTSEQINFWESEIRKLWSVTNDRNKKWIEDNRAAIEQLRKSLASLEAGSREVQSTVGRHEAAFAQQQQVVDRLTGIEVQIQQVMRSQRDLVDQVNAANQNVAALRSLNNRVKETEQAVAAIDAYRLQLNSRLADLERRLNSMSGAASL
jgi:DNA repair exonuclease SbcCD ATPase subunit